MYDFNLDLKRNFYSELNRNKKILEYILKYVKQLTKDIPMNRCEIFTDEHGSKIIKNNNINIEIRMLLEEYGKDIPPAFQIIAIHDPEQIEIYGTNGKVDDNGIVDYDCHYSVVHQEEKGIYHMNGSYASRPITVDEVDPLKIDFYNQESIDEFYELFNSANTKNPLVYNPKKINFINANNASTIFSANAISPDKTIELHDQTGNIYTKNDDMVNCAISFFNSPEKNVAEVILADNSEMSHK